MIMLINRGNPINPSPTHKIQEFSNTLYLHNHCFDSVVLWDAGNTRVVLQRTL